MEQIKRAVNGCKDIIETLKKIDDSTLQKLYEFNFLNNDDTQDLLNRIDSKIKYDNLTDIELYEIIIIKLDSLNESSKDLINDACSIIANKKFIVDHIQPLEIKNKMIYVNLYERNGDNTKWEDLDKDKISRLTSVCGIKQIEPIDERTSVMILRTRYHWNDEAMKFTNVLLPIEFNGFKTYKLLEGISVNLNDNKIEFHTCVKGSCSNFPICTKIILDEKSFEKREIKMIY